MIRLSSIGYSIKQGFINIKRNRLFSIASIGTITACLFLFGIFYFIISNFQYMIHEAETNVAITVLFDEGLEDEKINAIGEQIKSRTNEVDKIEFISGEEAWKQFQKDVFEDDERLIETFGDDNPLADSASYTVYLKDVSKQDSLVTYIEDLDGVRQVNRSDSTAKVFTSFNSLVGYVSAAIILILVIVSIFLISTTVTTGISVRKDEIGIMKLIGATDIFVRAPFIVEGMVIGLIGACIPLFGLYFMYSRVVEYISTKFDILASSLTFLSVNQVFQTLIPISLLLGMGIGFVGSFFTVRTHLKK